jgi:parallel beta-helix repeat protein
VADGGLGTIVNGKFESNEIGLSVEGKAVITKSSVETNRIFGAQVLGNVTFSDLTFERNPVGLTVVAPGVAEVNTQTKFVANVTHLEVSNGGKVIGTNAIFTESTGTCGVHVLGATATFTTCEFLQDSKVAIFSEGDLSIDDSRVEGAGEAGFVFGGGSTGTVSNSTIKKNGKVAAQVQGGAPTIKENTVSEHAEFGIYVIRGAQPIVEHNNFKSNGLANVWRGDAPR